MSMNQSTSHRISIIRFVMIFGVVLLHTPPTNLLYTGTGAWFDLFQGFFQSAMFRTTVPVLTFISAYLLFGSNIDLDPVRLYKKKCKTLVVPFLVFNGALLLGVYMAQQHTQSAVMYPLYLPTATAGQWVDAAFGYLNMPINYPLNFLRDLVMLIALTPLFSVLLRRYPVLGLLFVISCFMTNFDGALILRNNMAVMFYLGGLAAVYKIDINALDRHAGTCFALFLALCAAVVCFKVRDMTYLGLVAPVLIWPSTKLIAHTRAGNFFASISKYTFFIFIAHAPLVALSVRLYPKVQSVLPVPVYWVMTPVLVCAILIAVYKLAMANAPGLFSVMIGSGVVRPATPSKVLCHAPLAAG